MRAFAGGLVVFLFMASRTFGYSMYAMRVPNGGNVPGVTALGHVDPVLAGPMNEFGMDMIDSDFQWTRELCMKDSDGDGQTNGQELGDPCCEFVYRKHAVSRWSEGVSHPGDAAFKSDPKLWEGIKCDETVANVTAGAGEATTEVVRTEATMKGETVTEDTEEPVKVSSQKTEGANETETEAGEEASLATSTLLLAVVLIGLLGCVLVRMRRRQQWSLLPQQERRAQ